MAGWRIQSMSELILSCWWVGLRPRRSQVLYSLTSGWSCSWGLCLQGFRLLNLVSLLWGGVEPGAAGWGTWCVSELGSACCWVSYSLHGRLWVCSGPGVSVYMLVGRLGPNVFWDWCLLTALWGLSQGYGWVVRNTAGLFQVLKDEDFLLERAMTRGCYGLRESLGSLSAHGQGCLLTWIVACCEVSQCPLVGGVRAVCWG